MKYLVEEITKNSDAVTNQPVFYKQPDSVSGLRYAGPVWDYDNALGHTNEEAMDPVGADAGQDPIRRRNQQSLVRFPVRPARFHGAGKRTVSGCIRADSWKP